MDFLFRLNRVFKYVIKGKTKYYIHSPFVYSFINEVLNDKRVFYCYNDIEKLRNRLAHSGEIVEMEDFGAGASSIKVNRKRIKDIVAKSVKPRRYAQLFFRIAAHYNSKYILELGASLGLTTSYLASANEKSNVVTLEGSRAIAGFALQNFSQLDKRNITLMEGDFNSTLPGALNRVPQLDLVYFDGNHKREPTLNYFNQCLSKAHNNSVFIFDDIYWSKEMAEAWETIKAHERVTLTIDLFQLGIVFFRKEKQKENFVLYF